MGQAVTFAQRNCATVKLLGGVSYVEPSVGYKRGWLTGGTDPGDGSVECGDGTEYPIAITKDQLAEIYYRVRYSTIIGGAVNGDYSHTYGGASYSGTVRMAFEGGPPPTNLKESITDLSYTDIAGANRTNGSVSSSRAAMSISETLGGNTDYPTGMGGRFGDLYYINTNGTGQQERDPLSELALWTKPNTYDYFYSAAIGGGVNNFLVSGMSHHFISVMNKSTSNIASGAFAFVGSHTYSYTPTLPTPPQSGSYFSGAQVGCSFSPIVAFIDNSGSGDPFDPLNQLYLGFNYSTFCSYVVSQSSFSASFGVSTKNEPLDPDYEPTSARANLELSGGVVLSCPLYWNTFFDGGYLNKGVIEDVTIRATEWWPYAKADGTPYFDTTTGIRIP
jgi:hypothetical protein